MNSESSEIYCRWNSKDVFGFVQCRKNSFGAPFPIHLTKSQDKNSIVRTSSDIVKRNVSDMELQIKKIIPSPSIENKITSHFLRKNATKLHF